MIRKTTSIGTMLLLVLCCCIKPTVASGQQFKPLTISLEKDSSGKDTRSIRFLIWGQPQVVFPITANASGSTATADANGAVEFVLRRARFLALAQISPDDNLVIHFGSNSQMVSSGGLTVAGGTEATGAGKKPQLFLHDFYYDRRLAYGDWGSFYLGGGLHYWNGLSRASSASTITPSTIDVALQLDPFLETADQFARKFGFYAKGMLGPISYNIAVNFPFQANAASTVSTEGIATFNPNAYGKMIEGYFAWEFLDKESVNLAYKQGTYIGAKNVFNIGAGFITYIDGMHYLENGIDKKVTTFSFAVDMFGDLLLGDKGTAGVLNFYGVYNYNNLGPNYYRPLASDAVGDAGLIATGHTFMLMLQYITGTYLPTRFGFYVQGIGVMPTLDKSLLPNAALAIYDNRPEFWNSIEAGINWYAMGHCLRITLAFRTSSQYQTDKGLRSDKAFAQFAVSI